jgi:hypothetical protein
VDALSLDRLIFDKSRGVLLEAVSKPEREALWSGFNLLEIIVDARSAEAPLILDKFKACSGLLVPFLIASNSYKESKFLELNDDDAIDLALKCKAAEAALPWALTERCSKMTLVSLAFWAADCASTPTDSLLHASGASSLANKAAALASEAISLLYGSIDKSEEAASKAAVSEASDALANPVDFVDGESKIPYLSLALYRASLESGFPEVWYAEPAVAVEYAELAIDIGIAILVEGSQMGQLTFKKREVAP